MVFGNQTDLRSDRAELTERHAQNTHTAQLLSGNVYDGFYPSVVPRINGGGTQGQSDELVPLEPPALTKHKGRLSAQPRSLLTVPGMMSGVQLGSVDLSLLTGASLTRTRQPREGQPSRAFAPIDGGVYMNPATSVEEVASGNTWVRGGQDTRQLGKQNA
jgi:hypothetical protein